MRTVIVGGHVVDTPTRELTDDNALAVTAALAEQGIRIASVVDVFHVVHLWAQQPTTTAQEVTALAAFGAVTDCRLAWHKAVNA